MALLPMGLSTEERLDTQETMFEEPTDFLSPESQEAAYEDPAELSYETAEDFPAETVAVNSAASHASEHEPRPGTEPTLKPFQPEVHAEQPRVAVVASEPESMTVLTVDDFAALEERVLRAVNLVRREREARTIAEERAVAAEAKLQAQLEAQNPAIERLELEVESLRAEREQVRQRVERLLGQLDALEL